MCRGEQILMERERRLGEKLGEARGERRGEERSIQKMIDGLMKSAVSMETIKASLMAGFSMTSERAAEYMARNGVK